MLERQTWRSLLAELISTPDAQQQVLAALGVAPTTLKRWIKGEATPCPQSLRLLLAALPHHRAALLPLVQDAFVGFTLSPPIHEEISSDIPATFYARVLKAYAETSAALRKWSVSELILQQILGQLDPARLGLCVNILLCMPPSYGNKVRTLRRGRSIGNPPWRPEWNPSFSLVGAESLPGYLLTSEQPFVIQDTQADLQCRPARYNSLWARSVVASPIRRGTQVAGCLYVCSTQPDYFLPFRLTLLQNYAVLLTLAFDLRDFYALSSLELGAMPAQLVQDVAFDTFQERVEMILQDAVQQELVLKRSVAEQIVLQQIEHELLALSLDGDRRSSLQEKE